MTASTLKNPDHAKRQSFFIDLVMYLSVMFLIRKVYFPEIGFLANGLFWSCATLTFAAWRMRVRGVSWRDLGLFMPSSCRRALIATATILGFSVFFVIVFQLVNDQLDLGLARDTSNESAVSRFGELRGDWILFLTIIPFVWLQSTLEELLDRGFLISWIEKTLSVGLTATVFAVVAQAAIFGFRHSYDVSERSITVGLIGLAMGIGYVVFDRNLWPLIIAHCTLNTMSMIDRVI